MPCSRFPSRDSDRFPAAPFMLFRPTVSLCSLAVLLDRCWLLVWRLGDIGLKMAHTRGERKKRRKTQGRSPAFLHRSSPSLRTPLLLPPRLLLLPYSPSWLGDVVRTDTLFLDSVSVPPGAVLALLSSLPPLLPGFGTIGAKNGCAKALRFVPARNGKEISGGLTS